MRIHHIAIWTFRLEEMKEFYIRYFKGTSNKKYVNPQKGFESYFIRFDCGADLELMSRTDVQNTPIGENGAKLSGGERQRISIARALLKDAPILILDDSVSAVDTKTEKIILDNLKKSRAGKTTLLIAHRISTVEGLDKIIFLEDGRVEAVGPHDRLYASCPEYHKMVDLQKLEDEVGGGNA